jgi:DNA-directed RNA polymerase beta' subunit
MTKKLVITALLGAGLSLQAGMFDDAMKQVGGYNQSATQTTQTGTQTESNGLLSSLTNSLGITNKQAAGGTAALLQAASQSMPKENYTDLLKSVPGFESIANSGLAGSAMNMLGGSDMVGQAFKALGMDNTMIGKFAPIILEYAKQYATPENIALLKQAWSAFL